MAQPGAQDVHDAPGTVPVAGRVRAAEHILDLVGELLERKAATQGGELSSTEIRTVVRIVRRAVTAFATAESAEQQAQAGADVARQVEDLSPAPPDVRFDEDRREALFFRLMVSPFEHLLCTMAEQERLGGGINRRLLPNYFAALRAMMGDEIERRRQQECETIVSRLRQEHGRAFTWRHFFNDPGARRILVESLQVIAMWFRHYERRREWFMTLMNYRPTSASLGSRAYQVRTDPAPSITFTQANFRDLMWALFSIVDPKQLSPEERRWVQRIVGDTGQQAFSTIFQNLACEA